MRLQRKAWHCQCHEESSSLRHMKQPSKGWGKNDCLAPTSPTHRKLWSVAAPPTHMPRVDPCQCSTKLAGGFSRFFGDCQKLGTPKNGCFYGKGLTIAKKWCFFLPQKDDRLKLSSIGLYLGAARKRSYSFSFGQRKDMFRLRNWEVSGLNWWLSDMKPMRNILHIPFTTNRSWASQSVKEDSKEGASKL